MVVCNWECEEYRDQAYTLNRWSPPRKTKDNDEALFEECRIIVSWGSVPSFCVSGLERSRSASRAKDLSG